MGMTVALIFSGFLPPFVVALFLKHSLSKERKKVTQTETEKQILKVHLEKNEHYFQEKIQHMAHTREDLERTLKALCAEALQSSNRSFLDLAGAVLEKFQASTLHTWENQHHAISQLVSPLSQSLEKVDIKIQELEKVRLGAYEGLRLQISDLVATQKELRTQTGNLVNALRTPHVRGRWGEIQLRRVVEMAGMLPYCDFDEQSVAPVSQEGRRGRPDLLVKLPGGKYIVVDAKVPLNSYLDAMESPEGPLREEKMKDHARHVRSHVKALSGRSYWEQFQPTPELVILFLPGEIFFSAALEKDPQLLEYGADSQVILATPTTLIALLKAVSFGWRQEKMAENAEKISILGREIYKRLSDMAGHLSTLGRNLGSAVNSYNQTIGSLEHRVLPSARKFQELGLISEDQNIQPLFPLDHHPRHLKSGEMQ